MATIRFTFDVTGADPVDFPVTITTPPPYEVGLSTGPLIVNYQFQNTLQGEVTFSSIVASVIAGDPALLTVTPMQTTLVIPAGGQGASAITIEANQDVQEGMPFTVEVSAAESP